MPMIADPEQVVQPVVPAASAAEALRLATAYQAARALRVATRLGVPDLVPLRSGIATAS